jgi:uncharacterized repeat protein (TIGR02543 family)
LIPKGAVIEEGHICNIGAACWTCPSGTYLDPSGLAGCTDTKCLPQSEVNNYLGVNQSGIWASSPPYKSSTEGCPSGTAALECNDGYHWGSAEAYVKDVFGLVVNNDGTVGWGNTGQTWYAGLRCLPDKDNTITGCTNNPDICADIFGAQGPYVCIDNNCAVIITTTTTNIITTPTSTSGIISIPGWEGQNNPANNPANNPVYGHFECVNNSCQLVNRVGINTCVIGSQGSCKGGNDGIGGNVGTLPPPSSPPSLPPPPLINLTVNVSPPGSGIVNVDPPNNKVSLQSTFSYSTSTDVTLSVVSSSPGYVFQGWQGDCSGTNITCPVTVNSNKTVTAVFKTRGTIREIIPFRPPSLNEFLKQTASIFFGWR